MQIFVALWPTALFLSRTRFRILLMSWITKGRSWRLQLLLFRRFHLGCLLLFKIALLFWLCLSGTWLWRYFLLFWTCAVSSCCSTPHLMIILFINFRFYKIIGWQKFQINKRTKECFWFKWGEIIFGLRLLWGFETRCEEKRGNKWCFGFRSSKRKTVLIWRT